MIFFPPTPCLIYCQEEEPEVSHFEFYPYLPFVISSLQLHKSARCLKQPIKPDHRPIRPSSYKSPPATLLIFKREPPTQIGAKPYQMVTNDL
ncbi:hypothetical protein CEXT_69321 [Caerostris extrusa]|uniref:Uncharacterized protein n=1 Tax=Caerostris extrusa TaxID=172846 RepID=A0AAV4P4U2_CAEEX|nr:hypothetical protein CEXT_69321 [Caerostris extrusa]